MKCKCCNSENLNFLYEGNDRLHNVQGEFSLFTCLDCGVVSVRPLLSSGEINQYYPENYISYPVPIGKEKLTIKRLDRQFGVFKRRKKIERYTGKRHGKILDVGCATGVFLKEMQNHGWEAYGVEPSVYAAGVAVDQLGLDVFKGYLNETKFKEHFFDVITLWDVFEHLPDPVETLQIIKRILKQDGKLVITMPNTDSWERKIFKQYWAGWDVPRHCHIFSPTAIKMLLTTQGLHIERLISFTGMLGAIRISLDFWLQASRFSKKSRQLMKNVYYSSIFRLLLYPYILVSTMLNKSTSMTIFASHDASSRT
jgi:2-polyprenyl-3-methyl-5-hydroxy-6-metoxy-1,4-benzoquinol methylase